MRQNRWRPNGIFDALLLLTLLVVIGGAGCLFLNLKKETFPIGEEGINYYYYDKIENEQMKKQYERIYRGLYQQKSTISVDADSEEELRAMVDIVLCDHPELFWMSPSWDYRALYDTPVTFSPRYYYPQSERDEMQGKLDAVTEEILSNAPENATDYEKIKYIFKEVTERVVYDLEAEENQSVYSSLVNEVSVCSGYAKAVQYLAQKMGLECLFVVGHTKEGDGHAWNIVKLDGKYYQVDATYGDKDSVAEGDGYPKELQCDYSYLCLTDEEIYADREPEDYLVLPVCDSSDYNYYRLNELRFGNAKQARASMKKNVLKGSRQWRGAFTNASAYKKIRKELKNRSLTEKIYGWIPNREDYRGIYYSLNDTLKVVEIWY